jgi:crossover junction endodeoxyribonuclease RuvC
LIIVGIDPGVEGAAAFIDSFSGLRVQDLPIISDGKLKWVDGAAMQAMLMEMGPNLAIVERVSAFPGQGVASSFNFGVGFGSILSILQARGISIEFVTPSVWKRDLGLSKDKNASLHKARLLYPDAELSLQKHEGRAEAILIAHWRRTHGTG